MSSVHETIHGYSKVKEFRLTESAWTKSFHKTLSFTLADKKVSQSARRRSPRVCVKMY